MVFVAIWGLTSSLSHPGLGAHEDVELTRPKPSHELRVHCVSFCSAVSRHHTGEDHGAFALLRRDYPQLHPVLDKLGQDHVLVRGLLQSLQKLLDGIPEEPDAAAGTVESVLGVAVPPG